MNENNSNGLQTIITQVIEEMKSEQGDKFDINRINLAEMERRTGMTRAQLRRLKKNDFQITPHALNRPAKRIQPLSLDIQELLMTC